MQKIKVPDPVGRNLSVNLYTPLTETGKLAVLCPGYLHSKDYEHLVSLSEELNKKGFTVASFDPMGTWESDGDISDYTITQNLLDIKNIFEYMLSKNNYNKVILGGHSRGGGLSILFSKNESRISQVLGIMASAFVPFQNERYENWKKNGVETSYQLIPGTTKLKEFKVPFSYVVDREKYDVIEAAKQLKVPIVLVSGERDMVVKPTDIEMMYKVVNTQKKLIYIEEADHNYWEEPEILKKVNHKILDEIQ